MGGRVNTQPFCFQIKKTPQSAVSNFLLFKTITFSELINSAACINKLLLACVERMASRANFDTDVLFCRTRFNNVTASTLDCVSACNQDEFLPSYVVSPLSYIITQLFIHLKLCFHTSSKDYSTTEIKIASTFFGKNCKYIFEKSLVSKTHINSSCSFYPVTCSLLQLCFFRLRFQESHS